MELDKRYNRCCKDSNNWIIEYGEVVCNKCGRVLEEDIVIAIAFA